MDSRCREQMLSTVGVHVAVCEKPGVCPHCGGKWRVQKTILRQGKTMEMGQFEVRETVHVCAAGCRHDSGALVIRRASSLGAQIMPERSVGYDVMVCIGLERFLHRRQREEIRKTLADVGVYLSG